MTIKTTRDSHPIDLHIPPRRLRGDSGFDCNPAAVERWIKDLPVANIGETARLVYNALTEINNAELDDKTRFAILELLRAPVTYLGDILPRRYTGSGFPLTAKTRKIARLVIELHSQMAIGYKIIVANSYLDEPGHAYTGRLSAAIHRALYYLDRILKTSYQTYSPAPDSTWKDIHQLYHYAEQSNLLLSPVKDQFNGHFDKGNISDLYKQIILLAIATPSRLSQSQITRLSNALENWTSECRISALDKLNTQAGDFVIQLDSDTLPEHRVFNDLNHSDTCRILDTSGLTTIIRDLISQATKQQADDNANAISPDMLHGLMISWGLVPKRSVPRTKKAAELHICFGLNCTHHIMSSTRDIGSKNNPVLTKPVFPARSRFSTHAIRSLGEPEPDVWEMAYRDPLLNRPKEDPLLPERAELLYTSHKAVVANESAGGICLRWRTDAPSLTRVGELAGLSESVARDGSPWNVGAIRWLKNCNNDELEIGIQLISSVARPVAIRSLGADKITPHYQRSLLIPESKALQQPATLLTPPGLYKPGATVTIHTPDKETKVQLTHASEVTEGYTRFTYTIIDEVMTTDDLQSGTRQGEDFRSLWTSL